MSAPAAYTEAQVEIVVDLMVPRDRERFERVSAQRGLVETRERYRLAAQILVGWPPIEEVEE